MVQRVYEPVRAAIIYHVGQDYERDGTREFAHSVTGVHTFKAECTRVATHNEHHLSHIRAALSRQ